MTTREIQQRHREAALALTDDVAFSRENPQLQAWLKGEAGAPIGCLAEVDLSDVAELLANAELPAPSAPAAFDPFTAVTEWTKGNKYRVITGPHWNYCDFEMFVRSSHIDDPLQELEIHAETARDCYRIAAEQLGIAEPPQGKESI